MSEKMLERTSKRSYKVPEGFPIHIKHVGRCRNKRRNEEIVGNVRKSKPEMITELEIATKAVLAMAGCPKECGIDKTKSGCIAYENHTDESSYQQSNWTETTQGTGSLIGEKLFEGEQEASGTPNEITVGEMVETGTQSTEWPSSLVINSSEKGLYKGFKLDRSSDESYIPSKVVTPERETKDTPMNLGNNKNTERNGMGDSKHAIEIVPETQLESSQQLPATVPYSVSATQDILEVFEEFEAGKLAPKIDELISEPDMEIDTEVEGGNWGEMERIGTKEEMMKCEEGTWRTFVMERIFQEGRRNDDLKDEVEELTEKLADAWDKIEKLENRIEELVGTKGNEEVRIHPRVQANKEEEKTRVGKMMKITMDPDLLKKKEKPINGNATKNAAVMEHTKPTYTRSDEDRVTKSYAQVAKTEDCGDGFTIAQGRKRFEKPKSATPEVITDIPVKERHLTIKFERNRDEIVKMTGELTIGRVRNELNKLLFSLNANAHFSIATNNRWGDIWLTLANTRTEDIAGYYPAMRECLEDMGIPKFVFVRDTKKVKVYVGMVPLSRFGGGWDPKEWEKREAYEALAADIENSNPGIYVAAKPIWAGRLHKLKERKVNNAGLILVIEKSEKVNQMMKSNNPKITISGRPRLCRLWREDHKLSICKKCQQIGHSFGECRNKAVCAFCRKEHETRNHVCPVLTCKKKGMVCQHVKKSCFSCGSEDHWTGGKGCPAMSQETNTQSDVGHTPVRADNTSITGVTDNSKNRINRQYKGGNGNAVTETMLDKGISAQGIKMVEAETEKNRTKLVGEVRLTRENKAKNVGKRPSSTPAPNSSNKENETPSRW